MNYKVPNKFFKNPYLQTMFAKFFRPIKNIRYQRERITAHNDDFLDLDWSRVGSTSLAIVCHGLESNSSRRYMRGAIKALNDHNIDALAMNFRGCSGENNNEYFLQYGESEDLETIINHALKQKDYDSIFLIGCSVGGNLILKYLGEKSHDIDPKIKKAFLVSPTVDLQSSCEKLHWPENYLFLKGFLLVLFLRVWRMRKTFKNTIKLKDFFEIHDFPDFYYSYIFDREKLTLSQYFDKNSSWSLLKRITIPCKILFALDDPMIDSKFIPYQQAQENPKLDILVNEHGGHAGFVDFGKKYYWSERLMTDYFLDA